MAYGSAEYLLPLKAIWKGNSVLLFPFNILIPSCNVSYLAHLIVIVLNDNLAVSLYFGLSSVILWYAL